MKIRVFYSSIVSELSVKVFIAFLLSSVLAFLFVPDKALDLYRYYDSASHININRTFYSYLRESYLYNFDFIYFGLFFICREIHLPVQIMTGIFVGLFYSQSLVLISVIQNKWDYKLRILNRYLVDLFALLSVSFILVFSISRNVAAIVFLLLGIINLIKGRKRVVIYFILACFTHIFILPYLILFLIAYYFYKLFPQRLIVRQVSLIVLTIVCINSLYIMNFIFRLISSIPFFEHYSRYLMYLAFRKHETFASLGKWDIFLFYSSGFILLYGLFLIRKYNSLLWAAFIFYLFLVISISFSVTLTQRTVILLVPFQGLVASAFLTQKNRPIEVSLYLSLMFLSLALFVINVYSYRDMLHFAFPQ
jgi:hypothetical protein